MSFRLSARGWDIGYITPPTQEEAVSRLKPWTHQRTRWMKGFMQSWRVHMDRPFAPGGWRGLRRQITLQLTLGSVLLAGFLHAPILLGLLIWASFNILTQGGLNLPPEVTATLVIGYGSGIIIGAAGALRAGKVKLLLSVPLMPVYWLCLCVPTYKAAYEYVRRPYYWAKTAHGLTPLAVEKTSPAPDLLEPQASRPNNISLMRPPKPANDMSEKAAHPPKAAE